MGADYQMQNDEELMLAVGSGHAEALAELVERYHARMYAYVHRNLQGHHLSEDITQECFVRLLAAAGQYEYPRPFRPWLYTIAHNLCRSLGRSASFRLDAPLQAPDDLVGANDTEQEVMDHAQRDEVQAALDLLSPDHREVILLRFFEDMKLHDIAEVMVLPVGTVKSRLFYAVKALRERMEAHEHG